MSAVQFDHPPIVLISPAMAIGSGYYRPLVEEFHSRGWDARALTRRGFEPDLPRASRANDWTYADEIRDIADAVTEARADYPDRPVILLGHSLGGQLVAGHEASHEASHEAADGVVTVGGAIPWFRRFRHGGLPLAFMATAIVPTTTAVLGHLPKPFFGGPGARSMMREWSRMVITGRPAFPHSRRIDAGSLIISLEGDRLSPAPAVNDLARLFNPDRTTRWHYRHDEVPEGATNDHIRWVRTPAPVVDRIMWWWSQQTAVASRGPAAMQASL